MAPEPKAPPPPPLADESAFLTGVVEHVQDAVVALDAERRVILWNQAAEVLFGYTRQEAAGAPFDVLVRFDWTERERETAYRMVEQKGRWQEEVTFQPPHRRARRHLALSIRRIPGPGGTEAELVIARDLTEQVLNEEQLLHTATHDPLTGLANRSLFTSRLWKAIGEAQGDPARRYAVLYLDLDRFKRVNDSLGHQAGDRLLLLIAHRLRGSLPPGALLARLGGDEFAVLLHPLTQEAEAGTAAERLLRSLAEPFRLDGHDVFVGGSIGFVVGDAQYARPEEVLRDADAAMYQAKAAGSGHPAAFEAGLLPPLPPLIQFAGEIRQGLERDEFFAHYQPVVRLDDGSVAGFEALGRWHHPSRGVLPPAEFLAHAEELGLITEIERVVWREAARQVHAWRQAFPDLPPLRLSVNVANVQLHRPDFVTTIQGILSENGLAPEQLTLEITERIFLSDAETASTGLPALHAMGVRLALDDFGTGFSSLAMLHRLPVSTLKVDRSFTRRIAEDAKGLELVRAIANMARVLGMDVIVEGIETAEQLALVRSLGCEYGQGFLFSPPADAPAATDLLAQQPWRAFWL